MLSVALILRDLIDVHLVLGQTHIKLIASFDPFMFDTPLFFYEPFLMHLATLGLSIRMHSSAGPLFFVCRLSIAPSPLASSSSHSIASLRAHFLMSLNSTDRPFLSVTCFGCTLIANPKHFDDWLVFAFVALRHLFCYARLSLRLL